MTGSVRTAWRGLLTALMLSYAASAGFAAEPGDFQANLRGDTIGVPIGAALPPGLYAGLLTFVGLNGVGQGQNSAAAGAGPHGRGLSVFGASIDPDLVWATGWKVLGADLTFTVIQPFFTVAGLSTNCVPAGGLCAGSPPLAYGAGSGSFYENMHNTIWSSALSWNLAMAFTPPPASISRARMVRPITARSTTIIGPSRRSPPSPICRRIGG